MDKIIRNAESFSYSDSDIKRLLDDDVRIIRYPELANMHSVEEILGGTSCACILYMTKANFGHWTALIKDPGAQQGSIEIFDPYGMKPDEELKYIPDEFKQKSNQERQHLSYIAADDLKKGKIKEIFYNKYPLQSEIENTNTCGRWCAIRCLLKRLSIQEFVPLFIDQKLPPDAYVTLMTLVNK